MLLPLVVVVLLLLPLPLLLLEGGTGSTRRAVNGDRVTVRGEV